MVKKTIETIELNGKKYVPQESVDTITRPIETDHVIIIAQRGWIFIGQQNIEVIDKIQLLDASVVRSWSNQRGIGGLTKEAYKNDYKLDPVGQIEFPTEGIIATLKVEW